MAEQFNKNVFSSIYKDDYIADKNFYKILFNNGRLSQAREFTQLQTLIQEQIGRFGRNIFKEGAIVNPAGITINNGLPFIKLSTAVYPLPDEDLIGVEFTAQTSGIRFEIIGVVPAEGDDPATIFVKYLNSVGDVKTVSPSELLTSGSFVLETSNVNTVQNPLTGLGSSASISSGDVFVRGYFVAINSQTIIIDKYKIKGDYQIGFDVIEDIVTVADDESLYDNSGEVYNRSSPGADRYRIRLVLTTLANSVNPDNFIYYASVKGGLVTEDVQPEDSYNRINDLLALRTKEESGDYIVNPFIIKFDQDADESKLSIDISDGLAYIDGYRVEKTQHTRLPIEKSREILSKNNDVVGVNLGNYVDILGNTGTASLPNLSSRAKLNIMTGTTIIGTLRVVSINRLNPGIRLFISDVTMNPGTSFRDATRIGNLNIALEGGKAIIKNLGDDSLIFPLPYSRPQNVSDTSMVIQRNISFTSSGSGETSLTLGNTNESFADTSEWFVLGPNSEMPNISVTGSGTSNSTVSGLAPSTNYNLVFYVNIAQAQSRNKTLRSKSTTLGAIASGATVLLNEADVYNIVSVIDVNGNNITESFRFDNGQRSSFYDFGSITNNGNAVLAGAVVTFRYFEWSTVGHFCSVNSYSGQIPYEDIPSFSTQTGASVNLRSVLDFRPKVNTSSQFTTHAVSMPQVGDIIRTDVNYYKSRYAKLYLNALGEFGITYGNSSIDPKMPALSDDKILELYTILLNPYTLDAKDLTIIPKESKLFTMKDIGDIERNLESLKEVVSLSLLELETNSLKVLDENGNDRIKNGFFVDNFSDNTFCAAGSEEYRASIDPSAKVLRPPFVQHSLNLEPDMSESIGIVVKNDFALLDYTSVDYVKQLLKTGTENINPYAVITNQGFMDISPSSDSWMEVRYVPDRIIDGGTKITIKNEGTVKVGDANEPINSVISRTYDTLFGRSTWGWSGSTASTWDTAQRAALSMDISDARRDPNVSVTSTSSVKSTSQSSLSEKNSLLKSALKTTIDLDTITTKTTVSRVISDETIRKQVGDRVIDVDVIPFMRSKRVYFRVINLRPNTRMYPYFDNVAVFNHCKTEPYKTVTERTAANKEIFAAEQKIVFTENRHPDGSTPLITNANGELEGSFVIPCNASMKFRTGRRVFKLLDISTNDDDLALSRAETVFAAEGLLQTRERSILSTRNIIKEQTTYVTTRSVVSSRSTTRVKWDPLAQSFMVTNSGGMFVSEVDIFFKTKAKSAPVRLEIRPIINGYPSSDTIVPGAAKFLRASDVNISSDGSVPTTFVLDSPVYLNGDTEYAIVIVADTTEYNVFVAETYEFLVGSTIKRVSKQPTMGSLFKSQNGSTWTADQNKDLTFVIRRAKFETAGNAELVIKNGELPEKHLEVYDPLFLTAGSSIVYVAHPGHGLHVGDYVTMSGLEPTGLYGGRPGTVFNKRHTVLTSDVDGYTINLGAGNTSNSSARVGTNEVYCSNNYQFNIMNPSISSVILEGTSVFAYGKFTFGKSYAGNQTPYTTNGLYQEINLNEDNEFVAPLIVANSENEAKNIGDGRETLAIKLLIDTTSEWLSPIIDLERVSVVLTENIIDNQSATPLVGFNTPHNYFPETDASRGTAAAKHVTTPVSLEEDAVGIKVLLTANRPQAANIKVFYRTGRVDEDIYTKEWIEDAPEVNMPSDENRSVYRQYEYIIGGPEGSLSPFSVFQIKIVMNSTNSSQYPVIKDLRVIALGV